MRATRSTAGRGRVAGASSTSSEWVADIVALAVSSGGHTTVRKGNAVADHDDQQAQGHEGKNVASQHI